jgi:hypothetical protein
MGTRAESALHQRAAHGLRSFAGGPRGTLGMALATRLCMMTAESTETLECADCGELIEADDDRCFFFGLGAERAICSDCAERRGGAFSEDDGRWVNQPRIDDLNP